MRRRLLGVVFGVLLCGAVASDTHAQTVQGRVVDAGGQPVAVALVTLLDDESEPVRSVISANDGTYTIAAGRTGRFQIRVDRIGLTSTTTDPFDLAENEVLPIDITVSAAPVVVEGLEVAMTGRCYVRPQDRREIAELFDAAGERWRAASSIDPTPGLQGYTAVHYARELPGPGHGQTVLARRDFAVSRGAPFVAMADEILLKVGFTFVGPDGLLGYYGPSPSTILSETFLDTHCFDGVTRRSGRLGLRFQPVTDSETLGIGGTLWLDADERDVVAIDFVFVDPVTHRPNGGSGRIEVTRLPNGAAIVSRWWVRLPSVLELPPPNMPRGNVRILRHSEEGGFVLDPSGTPLVDDERLLETLEIDPDIDPDTVQTGVTNTYAVAMGSAPTDVAAPHPVVMRAVPRERYRDAIAMVRASLGTLTLADIELNFPSVGTMKELLLERFSSLAEDTMGRVLLFAYMRTAACNGVEPHYVIDGVHSAAEYAMALNPRDVASVNVLRYGAEVAKYGFRGTCGVIEITTR